MGFFDSVKNSLTETSQDLTKRAKDTSEIFRLNNANKAKEKEIEKTMYEIGIAYYSNYMEECAQKFPDLAEQVQRLQQEIAANKEAIERLSVEEVCPNCGKKVNSGSKFCIYCGAAITGEPAQSVSESGERCAACGKPLEEGAAFCTYCGTPVEK